MTIPAALLACIGVLRQAATRPETRVFCGRANSQQVPRSWRIRDMKKSAVVKALGAVVLVAVLLAAVGAVIATKAYSDCVSRIVRSAPPTDAQPPATFHRLSRAFWGHRDVGLARILVHE